MISVTILTKDSSGTIADVLKSVEGFNDVVVVDTGSSDDTIAISKSFANTTVYERPFSGFGTLHNEMSALAKNDWVLSLDSDEVLSKGLYNEIMATTLDSSCVYSFPMKNYFNKKHIKGCGWHPDRHVRLYNKIATRFSDDDVHEKIIDDNMEEIPLKNHVDHYSYRSLADFIDKMQRYSDLFAVQNKGKKTSSLAKALGHGIFAFIKCYIIKRGVLFGYEGLVISIYYASLAFYKYLKLKEINEAPPCS